MYWKRYTQRKGRFVEASSKELDRKTKGYNTDLCEKKNLNHGTKL